MVSEWRRKVFPSNLFLQHSQNSLKFRNPKHVGGVSAEAPPPMSALFLLVAKAMLMAYRAVT